MAAGQDGCARFDLGIRRDVGVRRIEDLHTLVDQREVDAVYHRAERDVSRAAVADLNDLIRHGHTLLRA